MEKVFYNLKYKMTVLFFSVFFIGCDGLMPSLYVLLGNYRYEQGRYQEAVLHYFKALESSKYPHPIYYNLGTAYYALGESESAIKMWNNLSLGAKEDLKGLSAFNEGVVYYQLGRYDESIKKFHQAAKYLPDRFEVKVNLELAINKYKEVSENRDGSADNSVQPTKEDEQAVARTLDYLRRRNLYFRRVPSGEEVWQQEENDW
ncbi:MAG: tetratricopeptide repeat protein [Spirochaetia bacterium]